MWEFRRDPERYERLKRLPARDAIAAFISGDFMIGDDGALAEAVRKGLSLPMSLDAVLDILGDCWDDGKSVDECAQRLIDESLK